MAAMLFLNSTQKIIVMSPQLFPQSDHEDGMKEAFEKIVGDQFDKDMMNYSLCDGGERRSAVDGRTLRAPL